MRVCVWTGSHPPLSTCPVHAYLTICSSGRPIKQTTKHHNQTQLQIPLPFLLSFLSFLLHLTHFSAIPRLRLKRSLAPQSGGRHPSGNAHARPARPGAAPRPPIGRAFGPGKVQAWWPKGSLPSPPPGPSIGPLPRAQKRVRTCRPSPTFDVPPRGGLKTYLPGERLTRPPTPSPPPAALGRRRPRFGPPLFPPPFTQGPLALLDRILTRTQGKTDERLGRPLQLPAGPPLPSRRALVCPITHPTPPWLHPPIPTASWRPLSPS